MSSRRAHEPSSRKLARARERGDFAHSTELTVAAASCAAAVLLVASADKIAIAVQTLATAALSGAGLTAAAPLPDLATPLWAVVRAAAPLLLVPALAALLVASLQSGFSFVLFGPRRAGAAVAIFSFARVGAASQSLAKLAVLAVVVGATLLDAVPGLLDAWQSDASQLGATTLRLCGVLLYRAALTLLVVGLADFAYQSRARQRRLRMTSRERADEHRESFGDPRLLAERKRRALEASMQLGLSELYRTSLVVHDGAERAVALRFAPEEHPAPRVWIKTEGELAPRMRDHAIAAGVPVRRDAALASALGSLETSEAVPTHLYAAVAAHLARGHRGHD